MWALLKLPRFGGASMQTITTIGLDIAKSVFQVHGVDAAGQVVIRRQLKRRYVLTFFHPHSPACPAYPPVRLSISLARTPCLVFMGAGVGQVNDRSMMQKLTT